MYAVQVIGSESLSTFKPLIDKLKDKRQACDRVIIYCPRIKVVVALYGFFKVSWELTCFFDRHIQPTRKAS